MGQILKNEVIGLTGALISAPDRALHHYVCLTSRLVSDTANYMILSKKLDLPLFRVLDGKEVLQSGSDGPG